MNVGGHHSVYKRVSRGSNGWGMCLILGPELRTSDSKSQVF